MTSGRGGQSPTPEFIPPLRFHWLTRYYDKVVAWTVRDALLKTRLLALLDAATGARVLDLGCGTGTLSLLVAKRWPEWRVTGLDADHDALELARRKAARQGVSLRFERGYAQSLPFADASFELAVSSLMFHHLQPAAKRAALRELRRVLVPGGLLVIADFGRADSRWRRIAFQLVRLLDGAKNTRDHGEGRFPDFLIAAGFEAVDCAESWSVPVGRIDLLRARNRAL